MPLDYASPPDSPRRPYGWRQRVGVFFAVFCLHAATATALYKLRLFPGEPLASLVFPFAYVPHWLFGQAIGRAWDDLQDVLPPLPFVLNSLPVALIAALASEAYHWRRRRPKV